MAGVKEFTVEEFLKHETRGRSDFVGSDWKKEGYIDVWLHTRRPFGMVWQHGIPRIDTKDDPETGRTQRKVFGGSYKCLEEESTLKDMYFRDKVTLERKTPPEICPICRLVEHVHMMVIRGELHWLAPVFDFDVGNRDRNILIRATGMWNGYKPAKLSDDQKAEMEDAGISPGFAWRESMLPGLKYIFCLVDDANPGRGVLVMKEGQALGDKVKLGIAKEMKRNPRNPGLGDPVQNPYPFRFEYKADETPDKKYDAFRMDLEITDEIQRLIVDADPPDISRLDGQYSPETLRSMLERVCQIDGLPWDDFFSEEACAALAPPDEDAAPRETTRRAPASPTPGPRGRAGRPAPPPTRPQAAPRLRGAPAAHPASPKPAGGRGTPGARLAPAKAAPPARAQRPEPADEMVGCDGCGALMRAQDPRCPWCGMEYDVEKPAAPVPLQPRKRSEAAPPPSRAVAGPPVKAAEPDDLGGDDQGFGEFGEDQIPFVHCRADGFGHRRASRWEKW